MKTTQLLLSLRVRLLLRVQTLDRAKHVCHWPTPLLILKMMRKKFYKIGPWPKPSHDGELLWRWQGDFGIGEHLGPML